MSLCGLRTFDIELLCPPSCEIIVLPYAGNHKEKSTWLLIIKLWASAFQMPENKLVSPIEALGEQLNMTRKHISVIESAIKRPSLDALVDIANALDVSTDDLLVDSLMHSTSTSNSEIHRLLLDCNEIEQEILTRMVKELKAILYGLGI